MDRWKEGEWVDGWVHGSKGGWINEWMMSGKVDGWMINARMEIRMNDSWRNGWVNE